MTTTDPREQLMIKGNAYPFANLDGLTGLYFTADIT